MASRRMAFASLSARIKRCEQMRRNAEKEIEKLTRERLLALPELYGFKSVDALILALLPFASAVPKSAGPVTRRARFGADVREKIRQGLAAGASAAQLSKEFGPSTASIKAWKRQWGMTRARAADSSSPSRQGEGP